MSPVVIERYRCDRFHEHRGAAGRFIVHDASEHVSRGRPNRHDVPARAHCDERFLCETTLHRGVKDASERIHEPVVGGTHLCSGAPEFW